MSTLNEINAGNKMDSMSYEQLKEYLEYIKSSLTAFEACDKPYVSFQCEDTGVICNRMYRTEAIKIFKIMYEQALYQICMKGTPVKPKYNLRKIYGRET